MEYQTSDPGKFLGDLITEVRYSYDKKKDISLIMVKVESGSLEDACQKLTDIKNDKKISYVNWCKYNDKPILAMVLPDFNKEQAEELISSINSQGGFRAVSTTYRCQTASRETFKPDAEKMIYNLVVKQLGL